MAAPRKKIVTVTLDKRSDKKSVVRFDGDDEGLSNVYLSKEVVKELGDPKAVKITIEAA